MANTITVSSDGNTITIASPGPQGATGPAGDARNITEVSATYTVLLTDAAVIATGTFIVSLPDISTATNEVTIKAALGTITLAGDGADTVEGVSSIALTTGQSVTIVPTQATTDWIII